jgi:hypothetical protein
MKRRRVMKRKMRVMTSIEEWSLEEDVEADGIRIFAVYLQ